jgi:3-methyladenine DNA glycosylase/8-oxoguanine DNA glycosylase
MITLPLPKGFHLPRAVCSYGYFMLAPHRWDGASLTLHTVLRDEAGRAIPAAVTQRDRLIIRNATPVSREGASLLRAQVSRMLRLAEDFSAFHKVHPVARKARFGCLFRSPTFFEDIVKTITTCNVTWPNTIRINALLCRHIGNGGFPTAAQLAAVDPAQLKETCRVGYRAERIIRLARDVHEGRLDLAWFERPEHPTPDIYDALQNIHGIGPYAAGNLCQLLSRYDRLAIDSETYRHFRQVHGIPTPRTATGLRRLHKRIEKHYTPFAPYQFLAYWFDLWGNYEDHFGDSKQWGEHTAASFTAAKMKD